MMVTRRGIHGGALGVVHRTAFLVTIEFACHALAALNFRESRTPADVRALVWRGCGLVAAISLS